MVLMAPLIGDTLGTHAARFHASCQSLQGALRRRYRSPLRQPARRWIAGQRQSVRSRRCSSAVSHVSHRNLLPWEKPCRVAAGAGVEAVGGLIGAIAGVAPCDRADDAQWRAGWPGESIRLRCPPYPPWGPLGAVLVAGWVVAPLPWGASVQAVPSKI